jgi:hypothetical protein
MADAYLWNKGWMQSQLNGHIPAIFVFLVHVSFGQITGPAPSLVKSFHRSKLHHRSPAMTGEAPFLVWYPPRLGTVAHSTDSCNSRLGMPEISTENFPEGSGSQSHHRYTLANQQALIQVPLVSSISSKNISSARNSGHHAWTGRTARRGSERGHQ